MYSPLPASANEGTSEDQPWRGVTPVTGLTHLARMSLIVSLVCLINVGLQSYMTASISETGDYSWDHTDASSVWAACISAPFTVYLFIVVHKAKDGLKSPKIHLMFGTIGCSLAAGLLLTGMVFSAITAGNIGTVKAADQRICLYFNSTYTTAPPPTIMPGVCFNCDPSIQSAEGVAPRTCCCCYQSTYNSYWTMSFFGVDDCDTVFDKLYPVSTTSAILYGLSSLIAFIACIVTCVVGCCQCRCCSDMCGPFSPRQTARIVTASGWPQRTYGAASYTQQGAVPGQGQLIVAAPVYNQQGSSHAPAYGAAQQQQQQQQQQQPGAVATATGMPGVAFATADAPPAYSDVEPKKA